MQTYKAIIAYDGTDFLGYQIQASGRTVQGTIEQALQKILKVPVRITGAGRTDAGVHATGQVIAFKAGWNHTPAKLQKALNANLPPDIIVTALTTAYHNFHPRFDARSRQYRYTILNQPLPDVLRRRYTLHVSQPLDVDRMQQAANILLGTHDFAAFGSPPQGNNCIRTVTRAEWLSNGSELTCFITANAFLYRMVRRIVGTLLLVGGGKMDIDDMKQVLQAKNRANAGAPVSPCGLCLTNVTY